MLSLHHPLPTIGRFDVIRWHKNVVGSPPMPGRSEAFGSALSAVRAALGLSQGVVGARLGVSRRTLTRWEVYGELPPVGQRKHIATSFPDAPRELRAELVRSLALGDGFVVTLLEPPLPPPPPGALNGAFFELCERLDVGPARVRAALVEFLRRAESSGFSLAAARAQLEPAAKPKRA
jgi:DNA-binding XRE family transcriptional regulator